MGAYSNRTLLLFFDVLQHSASGTFWLFQVCRFSPHGCKPRVHLPRSPQSLDSCRNSICSKPLTLSSCLPLASETMRLPSLPTSSLFLCPVCTESEAPSETETICGFPGPSVSVFPPSLPSAPLVVFVLPCPSSFPFPHGVTTPINSETGL